MAATEENVNGQPEDWNEPSDQQAEQELAISKRVGNWRTILSFGFALFVMAFVVVKIGIDPAAFWHRLRTLNLGLFIGAFVIYYLTFPLRGFRWKRLLENAYRETHQQAIEDMSALRLPIAGTDTAGSASISSSKRRRRRSNAPAARACASVKTSIAKADISSK